MEELSKYIIQIIEAVITAVTIVISLISVFRSTRNKRDAIDTLEEITEEFTNAKTDLEISKSRIEESEKIIKLIKEVIPSSINEAEYSGLTNGATKKMYCLSRILLQCNSLGIDYNSYAQEIDAEIERLIDLTNNVNA